MSEQQQLPEWQKWMKKPEMVSAVKLLGHYKTKGGAIRTQTTKATKARNSKQKRKAK